MELNIWTSHGIYQAADWFPSPGIASDWSHRDLCRHPDYVESSRCSGQLSCPLVFCSWTAQHLKWSCGKLRAEFGKLFFKLFFIHFINLELDYCNRQITSKSLEYKRAWMDYSLGRLLAHPASLALTVFSFECPAGEWHTV